MPGDRQGSVDSFRGPSGPQAAFNLRPSYTVSFPRLARNAEGEKNQPRECWKHSGAMAGVFASSSGICNTDMKIIQEHAPKAQSATPRGLADDQHNQ